MSRQKSTAELPDYARQSRFLSIDEARTLLGGISRTSFWHWRKRNKLPMYQIGGKKCRYDELIWAAEKIKE